MSSCAESERGKEQEEAGTQACGEEGEREDSLSSPPTVTTRMGVKASRLHVFVIFPGPVETEPSLVTQHFSLPLLF